MGAISVTVALLAPAVQSARTSLPTEHWLTAQLLVLHGRCLTRLARHDEAEPKLLEAHERLASTFGDDHSRTRGAVRALAELYDAMDRPADADQWRETLPE